MLIARLVRRGAGSRFRFSMPGGLIVGAMAASGVLHGGGWRARVPARSGRDLLVHRDGRDDRHAARRRRHPHAGAARAWSGIGALLVGTTVGCLFARRSSLALLSLRLADVVMAYAPGAIEAMTIIAFALHLDPVFVGVHHLARFTFMSLVLPAAVGADPGV